MTKQNIIKIFGKIIALLIFSIFPCTGVLLMSAESGMKIISVDANKVKGTIRNLQGVNVGPSHTRPGIPELGTHYKDLEISSVRTHDFYGPGDIDAYRAGESWDEIIFPDWNCDPQKEESYNFRSTDRLLKAIVDCGAEIYFRIGRSWDAVPDPPDDFNKFAEIVRHIVLHYNSGWAKGFRWKIRYWEFWNEPNSPRFWSGTPEQFYNLYEKTARTIKSVDSSLKVGACGLAGGTEPGPFREGLIQYCSRMHVPLDFYSWHHYYNRTGDPYELVQIAQTVRKILDTNNFKNAENHCTEWNYSVGRAGMQYQNSMEAAAFTATALIYLQDTSVNIAHYYRGDAGHPMGIFETDGSLRKKGYAFKAMARILQTPERLSANGGDTAGFGILAGRSKDTRTINVLVSNYELFPVPAKRQGIMMKPSDKGKAQPGQGKKIESKNNQGYRLLINNLPWKNRTYTLRRYWLTKNKNFELIDEKRYQGTQFKMESNLPSPGVELIMLQCND